MILDLTELVRLIDSSDRTLRIKVEPINAKAQRFQVSVEKTPELHGGAIPISVHGKGETFTKAEKELLEAVDPSRK